MNEENIKRYVRSRLEEIFDSFVVVGFHALSQDAYVVGRLPNSKSTLAINAILENICAQGGLSVEKKAK